MSGLPEPLEPIDGEGPRRPFSWHTVVRNRWIILACTVAAVAIAVVLTRRSVPVYEGASTLRIEQKESNLPESFRTLSMPVSWLPTEMEELRSRALASDVVTELSLRLAVLEPQARRRSDLLRDIRVADSAQASIYRLATLRTGGVALVDDSTGQQLAVFVAHERVEFAGFSFALVPAALPPRGIRFVVRSSTAAAVQVASEIAVTQPSRDVNIVKVSYRSPDPELAWRVPQALVTHYIAQRQELQTLELRSTIDYLQNQIVTIATQLAEAEQKLESYRERNDVIDPQTEASNQVTRLVTMQTERSMLEDDRTSIAALLAEVDATAAAQKPGQPSAYRRLLAFPKLLQSEAAAGLLKSLTTAEDERKALLVRRTPQDSDVQALDQRIHELERELRGMAATYHQGVTSQIQSLDSSLAGFRRQLQAIPEKELQYARLERQPKVLEGVYTMLQTRLKEAEVTVAARDPSVRIVDAAIPPLQPVWPNPILNGVAALMCGLLLGVGIAFTREYLDRAVRSRMDVRGSTGLSVIGMIPRISRNRSTGALIAEPKRVPVALRPPTPQLRAQDGYTFLGTVVSAAPAEALGTPVAPEQPPMEGMALTISAAGDSGCRGARDAPNQYRFFSPGRRRQDSGIYQPIIWGWQDHDGGESGALPRPTGHPSSRHRRRCAPRSGPFLLSRRPGARSLGGASRPHCFRARVPQRHSRRPWRDGLSPNGQVLPGGLWPGGFGRDARPSRAGSGGVRFGRCGHTTCQYHH